MVAKWQLASAVILVLTGLALVLTVVLLYTITGGKIPFDHGVIIDAGSSHSGAVLYNWKGDKDRGTGRIAQIGKECDVKPGISSYDNPMEAGESIIPCLNNLSSLVPKEKRTSTAVYLGATAGMRILNMTNRYQSLAMFTALSCTLPKSSLMVKEVGIISGEAEGQFAWITNNFLLEILQNGQSKTVGAVDLGGASTQIAFEVEPSTPANPFVSVLTLYGKKYNVYSASSLCYGANEVYRRYLSSLVQTLDTSIKVDDPCSHKGQEVFQTAKWLFETPCTRTRESEKWLFLNPEKLKQNFTFQGTFDLNKCQETVAKLYDRVECAKKYVECFTSDVPLTRSEKFIAFSGIFFTVTFMMNSTNPSVKLEEYQNKVKAWCAQSWDVVSKGKYKPGDLGSVPKYCFQANMVELLLTKGYGFTSDSWNKIEFKRQLNETSLGWTVGYMVNATNAIPPSKPSGPVLSEASFLVLLILGIILLVTGLIFSVKIWRDSSRR